MESFLKRLEARRESGGLRSLSYADDLVDFSSNDYLGFARDKTFQHEISKSILDQRLSHGSGGSRLISGNSVLVEETERSIAKFHGAEAALMFNSGYDANLGLMSSIAERGDTILYDELSHASIRDGIRLSLARSFSFRHNDLEDLKAKAGHARGNVWVVVESIYSMDGDTAPLKELSKFCDEKGYKLVVDEAHALGVFGLKGEGLVFREGLQDKVWARIVTFGKALGAHGAAVLGSNELRDFLINFARSFIYSTASPQSSIAAIESGYRRLPEEDHLRRNLFARVSQFLEGFSHRQILVPSQTQIQALVVPGNQNVLKVVSALKEKGLSVHAIRAPTVPQGSERVRLAFHAFNSEAEINLLVKALHDTLSV